MPLLSVVPGVCCSQYLNISATKATPDTSLGVILCTSPLNTDYIIVRQLMAGSLLAAAGLKVGDTIIEICQKKPKGASEAADILRASDNIEVDAPQNPIPNRAPLCTLVRCLQYIMRMFGPLSCARSLLSSANQTLRSPG